MSAVGHVIRTILGGPKNIEKKVETLKLSRQVFIKTISRHIQLQT